MTNQIENMVRLIMFLIGFFLSVTTLSQANTGKRLELAVIAHSISTRIEAREVLRRQKWAESTNILQADGILVVCRSGLSWPLNSSYDSVKDLDEDADSQLNISGSNFHIYIYTINNDLSVVEIKHIHYPADS